MRGTKGLGGMTDQGTHAQRRRSCLSAPLHEVDVCDDQRVIAAGADSVFVQVVDIYHLYAGRDADAVIVTAQVLAFPSAVIRIGEGPVWVVPYAVFQVCRMVGVPQAQDVFGLCTRAIDQCLFLRPPRHDVLQNYAILVLI